MCIIVYESKYNICFVIVKYFFLNKTQIVQIKILLYYIYKIYNVFFLPESELNSRSLLLNSFKKNHLWIFACVNAEFLFF